MVKFYYKDIDAPKPNQPLSIGCVAIIRNGEKILLESRSDSNRWAFIGGKMEDEEDAENAIIREIKEETNLTTKSVKLVDVLSDPSRLIQYPDGNCKRIVTILFEAEIKSFVDILCSSESKELQFLTIDEIMQKKIAETHIPILDFLSGYREPSIVF